MKGKFSIALVLLVSLLFYSFLMAQLAPMEQLGKKIFFDKISSPDWMSCATCHAPEVGFTGPRPGVNLKGSVYFGAVPQRAGNRKPPSAAYATHSPIFHYDEEEELFIGGNFWDGRATGEHLENPAADQALGPFLNPVEQNNPDRQAVLEQIARSKYAYLWTVAYGEPISWATPEDIDENYGRVGLAIAAYEGSSEVNQFSSKFDYFYRNLDEAGIDVTAINMENMEDYNGFGLSENEVEGLALFNDEGKGKCSLCHTMDTDQPLFTDFSFDNLGIPKNPDNPFYEMDEVFLPDGSPINPLGDAWIDKGLGGFLETRPEWQSMAPENMGKHKVPTLRNVDKRPGSQFPKAFGHNGYFKSLEDIVHFYNTRDVEPWPAPEVPDNVNMDELGDLGLSAREEALIVLFMKTLSDGYKVKRNEFVEESLEPSETIMVQNFPNPFNPVTTISFAIPTDQNVKIVVYNSLGQVVETLLNERLIAGEHSVQWNANQLPSGIYFYQIQSGDYQDMRKMILMK
jgi:cytochrome c peroxidase